MRKFVENGKWIAIGDSFVSAEHAKKIATEALQAKLREVGAAESEKPR